MATPRILSREEALQLVRRYKQVIAPRFNNQVKVMMYGSYAKGSPNQWSDIDVAVIIPKYCCPIKVRSNVDPIKIGGQA